MSSWRASPEANTPEELEGDGGNELAAGLLHEEEGRRRLQEERRVQEEATQHFEQEREQELELERRRKEREQQYAEEQRRQAERQREASVEVPQYRRCALVIGCTFSSFCKFKSISNGSVSVLSM